MMMMMMMIIRHNFIKTAFMSIMFGVLNVLGKEKLYFVTN